MSWKSLVTAGLLCALASPVFAVPTLVISGSINNKKATPERVWNIAAGPDLVLAPAGTALALELGFQATGGNILSITTGPNEATLAAPAPARVEVNNNPGNVIFGWEALTDVDTGAGVNMKPVGVQLGTGADANKAVAFIAENLFTTAGNRDLITITTQASVTSLAWGGRYDAGGNLLATTGNLPAGGLGRIAQGNGASATNYQDATYAGTSAALSTPRFLGDMNGNGSFTFADLTPLGTALSDPAGYKTANPRLNILRGDANGNNGLSFADLTGLGQILQGNFTGSGSAVPEPASCMLIGLAFACFAGTRRRSK